MDFKTLAETAGKLIGDAFGVTPVIETTQQLAGALRILVTHLNTVPNESLTDAQTRLDAAKVKASNIANKIRTDVDANIAEDNSKLGGGQ